MLMFALSDLSYQDPLFFKLGTSNLATRFWVNCIGVPLAILGAAQATRLVSYALWQPPESWSTIGRITCPPEQQEYAAFHVKVPSLRDAVSETLFTLTVFAMVRVTAFWRRHGRNEAVDTSKVRTLGGVCTSPFFECLRAIFHL
jgi:hypothetical protein